MPNPFDFIPQPVIDPVAFDETDRIDELTGQLTQLDPTSRMLGFDPLGWKRRSRSVDLGDGKATTARTKGDVGKALLNTLFEGIKAAGSGQGYQNPWEKQRNNYIEDYKLQAPRLIDELKILNQNKRAAQAEQSRENIQKLKNEASSEAATIAADAKRYATDKTFQTAEKRSELLTRQQNWLEKHGKNAKADDIALMRSINIPNISEATAQQAEDFLNLRQQRDFSKQAGNTLIKGLGINPLTSVPDVSSSRYYEPGSGEYQTRTTTRNKFVKGPLPEQNVNALQQIMRGQLPQIDASKSLDILPKTPGSQPAQKPIKFNDVKPAPVKKVAGPLTTQRVDVEKPLVLQRITDDDSRPSLAQYKNFKNAKLISDDGTLQNQIWEIQNSPDPNVPGRRIEPNKLFPGTQNKENRKQFEANLKSATGWSGITDVVARQFIKYNGKLLTGFGMDTATEMVKGAPESGLLGATVGTGMKATGKALAGRAPDQIDDFISVKSVRAYLDDMFSSSGKQTNQLEQKLFKAINPSEAMAPRVFLTRVLRLAVAMNQQVERDIERGSVAGGGKGIGIALPTNADKISEQDIENRVTEILKYIDAGKWSPALLGPIVKK